MLSPTISAYRDDHALKQVTVSGLLNLLCLHVNLCQNILTKYPGWGYTKAVKNDKSKSKTVHKVIQKDFTDIRCDIKKTVSTSHLSYDFADSPTLSALDW